MGLYKVEQGQLLGLGSSTLVWDIVFVLFDPVGDKGSYCSVAQLLYQGIPRYHGSPHKSGAFPESIVE